MAVPGLVLLEHGPAGRGRGGFAVIDDDRLALAAAGWTTMKPPPPMLPAAGIGDRHGKRRGDGGIDRVAALLEDLPADVGSLRGHGDDHAARLLVLGSLPSGSFGSGSRQQAEKRHADTECRQGEVTTGPEGKAEIQEMYALHESSSPRKQGGATPSICGAHRNDSH